MFPKAAAVSWSRPAVDALSTASIAAQESPPTPEGTADDEENATIPAGFTYIGQFIDHDLTLNPEAADLSGTLDPATLVNQRTPKFDMDDVYGSGPTGSPQLYAADDMHLRLGSALTGSADSGTVDQLRDASGQAVIGDPRNDENRLVASFHTLMMRFHNQEVDRIRQANPKLSSSAVFSLARQQTTWNYQWAVLHDFLPAIVGQDMVNSVLPSVDVSKRAPNLRFYNPCTQAMPVEFNVAAYRFGHSMVRPIYRINSTVPRLPVFDSTGDPTTSLVGFGPSPSNFGVDWNFLLPIDGRTTVSHPQASYKFDTSLTHALSLLPLPDSGDGVNNLASRNLLRAEQLDLPSGQEVARAMGLNPLPDSKILVGKATGDPADAEAITRVSPEFAGKAPLWTYILAEAIAQAYPVANGAITGPETKPFVLGPVGGRIVSEVFVGLMAADHSSVLYQRGFAPDPALTSGGRLGFAQVIAAVAGTNLALGKPVSISDGVGSGGAAVDGRLTTTVTLRQGASATVDLGRNVNLKRVNVAWSGPVPSRVTVQATAGDGRWRTLWSGNGQRTNLAIGQLGGARSVRVLTSGGPATLAELQVFRQPVLTSG
jgi:Animal haem peroxidase